MSERPEFPSRLVDDPELGASMRSARDRAMSPERLAAAAGAIDREIAALPPRSGFPRLPRVIGLAAVALVALVGIRYFRTSLPVPAAIPAAPVETTIAPVAAVADVAVPATVAAVVPPATPRSTASSERPKTAAGTLAEELRMFEEARGLSASGDHEAALQRLESLVRRFPATALAPEIDITRAETLVAAQRFAEAIPLLSRLVTDPVHAGRRAELERILGDVLRMKDDCVEARLHYRAALDAGASGEEASAARRGLGACETMR